MTVVLVHGAWHDPWHWSQVIERLSAPTVTVDLPSCRVPYGDMHDDATEVRRVLDGLSDVTLVAHSYGGIPATQAAAGHPSVSHLLYLAAYNADVGEALAGFEPADPGEANIRPATDCEMTSDGLLRIRPDRAAEVLFHDCPDAAAAIARLRPMSPTVLGQAPTAVAWRELPSVYAVCTNDRATAVSVQRRLSRRAQRVVEIDSGHSPFLAQPDQVAQLIEEVPRILGETLARPEPS